MRVGERGDVHRGEVLRLNHGFRLGSGWGRDADWESYGAAIDITYFGVAGWSLGGNLACGVYGYLIGNGDGSLALDLKGRYRGFVKELTESSVNGLRKCIASLTVSRWHNSPYMDRSLWQKLRDIAKCLYC